MQRTRSRKQSQPGEILRRLYMKPLGLDLAEFARRIDVSQETIDAILSGLIEISPEIAAKLSRGLNTTPELWLNIQRAYSQNVA